MNQADNSPGAAAGMRLSVSRNALRGIDSDNDGVALGSTADSHRNGFALVQAKRKRKGRDGSDFQAWSPRLHKKCWTASLKAAGSSRLIA